MAQQVVVRLMHHLVQNLVQHRSVQQGHAVHIRLMGYPFVPAIPDEND